LAAAWEKPATDGNVAGQGGRLWTSLREVAMNGFQMDGFIEAFGVALVISMAWLAACRLVVRLRDWPCATYGVAIALTWVPTLLQFDRGTIFSVSATLFCDALICLGMIHLLGNAPPARNRPAILSRH
jgi:hypothetical protein